MIAMGKLQFSATTRGKFKMIRVISSESGVAGRNHLCAGQICCIKAFGLSPVGTVIANGLKQENMIVQYIEFLFR